MWDAIINAAVVGLDWSVTTAPARAARPTLDLTPLTPSQRMVMIEIDAMTEIEQIKKEHAAYKVECANRQRAQLRDLKETIERHRARKADPTTTYLPGTILFRGE
ncbi:hypothetical protein HWD35_10225 [Tsukamurella tyrosinosolvens]|uniref:hypothetical protein n=1 Tax=Tsukamurella tyrosinosolvens TaxID=57704 RepID=UPI001CE1C469|nr:hypothetical protein [Tsukamurella tyrosinosolvens]MCA4995087.1 hypothetical protein [Tsukamurella tyrosinosolvens]